MNAEDFYEDFKAALRFLGLDWGQMGLATVRIDGDKMVLSHGQYSATITLKKDAA